MIEEINQPIIIDYGYMKIKTKYIVKIIDFNKSTLIYNNINFSQFILLYIYMFCSNFPLSDIFYFFKRIIDIHIISYTYYKHEKKQPYKLFKINKTFYSILEAAELFFVDKTIKIEKYSEKLDYKYCIPKLFEKIDNYPIFLNKKVEYKDLVLHLRQYFFNSVFIYKNMTVELINLILMNLKKYIMKEHEK